MQNEVDKKRLAQLADLTAKRKNERELYFPQKEKLKTVKPSASSTTSEKYKQMVFILNVKIRADFFPNQDEHKIELDELYKRLKVDPANVCF